MYAVLVGRMAGDLSWRQGKDEPTISSIDCRHSHDVAEESAVSVRISRVNDNMASTDHLVPPMLSGACRILRQSSVACLCDARRQAARVCRKHPTNPNPPQLIHKTKDARRQLARQRLVRMRVALNGHLPIERIHHEIEYPQPVTISFFPHRL